MINVQTKIAALFVLLFSFSCGSQEPVNTKKSVGTKNSKNQSCLTADCVTSEQTQGTSQERNSGEGTASPTPTPVQARVSHESFFNTNVRDAVFKKVCISCHVGPRVQVATRGPESVYVYKSMLTKLIDSDDPLRNSLVAKVLNINKHTGGDQCPNGLTDPVCKAILDWWEEENGKIENRSQLIKPQPEPFGVNEITATGRLSGWAVDSANKTAAVPIKVYIDQPQGGGTPVTQATANLNGYDAGADGDHAFSIVLPDAQRDGKSHTAYVYGTIGGKDVLLTSGPMPFTSYKQDLTNGKPYYDANLAQSMRGSCSNCHSPSYDAHWAPLLNPPKSQGGTNTNNYLYGKICGNINHSGGKFNGVCSNIMAWWDQEFGSL